MLLRTAKICNHASKMTRTSTFILPLLAILNNVGAYRVQRCLPVTVFSRSFMANTVVLKMGDVEETSPPAKTFAAHQVYIGNLPFSVDEQRLTDIVSERAQGCVRLACVLSCYRVRTNLPPLHFSLPSLPGSRRSVWRRTR